MIDFKELEQIYAAMMVKMTVIESTVEKPEEEREAEVEDGA